MTQHNKHQITSSSKTITATRMIASKHHQQQQQHNYFLRAKSITNSSTVTASVTTKTTLTRVETACGLFDTKPNKNSTVKMNILDNHHQNTFDNNQFLTDADLFEYDLTDKEEVAELDFQLNTTVNSPSNHELNFEKQVNLSEFMRLPEIRIAEIQQPKNSESKFMKKFNDQNMKLQIPPKRQDSSFSAFDDLGLQFTITPNMEKVMNDLMNGTPSVQQTNNNNNNIIVYDESCLQLSGTGLSAFMTPQLGYQFNTNPLSVELAQLAPIQTVHTPEIIPTINPLQIQNSVTLDHDYTPSPIKKRPNLCLNENTSTSDSFSTNECDTPSSCATTSTGNKKKRPRGVYRAQDVTNEEDLASYLERRKKNNVSSKQSRLAKKKTFNSMDEKANELEQTNTNLKDLIKELERLRDFTKNVLVQQCTSSQATLN